MTDAARPASASDAARVGMSVCRLRGIAPANQPQVSVNIDVKVGYVID
jgi:hypothetical protein